MKFWPIALLSLLPTWAMALETGDSVAPWTLLDQFDQPYSLNSQARVLLVARDMDGAKLLDTALQGQPKGYLEQRDAVFLADVEKMPALIAKLFAVPAMRGYNYRVMLDRKGRIAPQYPAQAGQVLWIELDHQRVVAEHEFTDAAALHQALEQAKKMISAQVLSSETLSVGWCLYVPLLVWAALRAPWLELFSDTRRQHLLFGTVLGLFLLWLVRRDFDTGVSYHFIGMTAVTLLLDWPLAILGGLVAQIGLILMGRQDLVAGGINGLLLIGLPVLVTEVCAILVERAQPKNPFVYIFCSGFFPAALAALLCVLAGLGLLWVDGRFAMPEWIWDFIGYLWLIIFPEAFINGMIVSALVVFCPEWLETFNRTRYLQAPWKDDDLR